MTFFAGYGNAGIFYQTITGPMSFTATQTGPTCNQSFVPETWVFKELNSYYLTSDLRIRFTSTTTGSSGGPIIDDVSVSQIS